MKNHTSIQNVIILSKNYENYTSGYYHQDIINAFYKLTNVFLYGFGYYNYNIEDNIDKVIKKSPFKQDEIDLIICNTSWDNDNSLESVDPHPNINLSQIADIKKIFFLNKEYKKLDLRFQYIKKNKFDLVCTVHPDAKKWEDKLGIKFLHLPFGISLKRFKDLGLNKKFDFSFTGALHKEHTDYRYMVKKKLFQQKYLDIMSNRGLSVLFRANPINKKFIKYNIYWAEWGSKTLLYTSMLPSGIKYARFMNESKVFLNTPSAFGIFNTRFFELMATKSLILCPISDTYTGILKDGYNCVMFKPDMSDFNDKLIKCIEDDDFRNNITQNAYQDVEIHSYDSRIKTLLKYVKKDILC